MTDDLLLEIMTKIRLLDPSLEKKYTFEQLLIYVELAYSYVSSFDDLDESKVAMAVALKTLALAFLPENSSLTKKKIKDVEITYFQGQGKNKWEHMFDSLIKGKDDSDTALRYIG
ncbi:MAG: hypothetical protein ACRC6E_09385, partial [Fusobacteriaceae bacterium]